MAHVFACLMENGAKITDQAIFSDTSRIIESALDPTRYQSEESTDIAHNSFEMALR